MLTDIITLNDGTTDHNYETVARSGMSSERKDLSADTTSAKRLKLDNTIDPNPASLKHSRHYQQLSENDIDATTGDLYPVSVSTVVKRHPKASDALVSQKIAEMSDLLGDASTQTKILSGAN